MVVVKSNSKSKKKKHFSRWLGRLVTGVGLGVLLAVVVGVAYSVAFWGKIVPGVRMGTVEVGNMSAEEALKVLQKNNKEVLTPIEVVYGEQSWVLKPEEIEARVNLPATASKAWLVGREGGLERRLGEIQKSFFEGTEIKLVVEWNGELMDKWLMEVKEKVEVEAIKPSVLLEKEGVRVDKGRDGLVVDEKKLKEEIAEGWRRLRLNKTEVPTSEVKMAISEEVANSVKVIAEKMLKKGLSFKLDKDVYEWDDKRLVEMVAINGSEGFDEERLEEAALALAKAVERKPQNAAFKFEGGRVVEFRPGVDGVEVKKDELKQKVAMAWIELGEKNGVEMEIPVARTEPAIKTSQVNDLGIKELLGRGESSYKHSIANRVHNVALAASRVSGVLVPPGAEFSFNAALGDVSAATGFLSAYVISGGRTVLGDGGGVCQVSTTLFRAALNAGLPIVERRAHAYRVSYYEEDSLPGIDATVFDPSVDFKFKNDTPGYLLIQSTVDSSRRYMKYEIYGTSDGRVASITTPKIWGQSPPPPALYQDDPTLPVGTTKQVDWAASGAKTSFDYLVKRGGETIIEKTFTSNYRPWQAVYLKGTKVN